MGSTPWWRTPARCRRDGLPRGCPTGRGSSRWACSASSSSCSRRVTFGRRGGARQRGSWPVPSPSSVGSFLVFSTTTWNHPYRQTSSGGSSGIHWWVLLPLLYPLVPRGIPRGGGRAVPRVVRGGTAAAQMVRNRSRRRRGGAHPDVRVDRSRVPAAAERGVRVPLHRGRRGGPEVPPLRHRCRHQQDRRLRNARRVLHCRLCRGRGGAGHRDRVDARPVPDGGGRRRDRRRLQPGARARQAAGRSSRLRNARDAVRGAVGVLRAHGGHLCVGRHPAPDGSGPGRGDGRTRRDLVAGRRPAARGGDVAERGRF